MFESVVRLKVVAAEEPTAKVPELAFTVMVCVFWPETVAARPPFLKCLLLMHHSPARENQKQRLSQQLYQHHRESF